VFTKKPEVDGSLRPGAQPSGRSQVGDSSTSSNSASVIGADLSVTGSLTSKGEVQVEGEVQGDIHAKRLVIGEHATIIGGLIAEEVVVRGKVQGSVRGNNVVFQSSSHVEGDVFHKSLTIEQGAFFEGKSRRADDPMSVPRQNRDVSPTTA